jgi:hypothetical protein
MEIKNAEKMGSIGLIEDEICTANESARNSARNSAKLAGFLAVSTIASGSLAFTTLYVNLRLLNLKSMEPKMAGHKKYFPPKFANPGYKH